MISGRYWDLHDDTTIRKIDAAARRLLTGSGARIEHDGLLNRLGAAGCRIDHSACRCVFAEKLIEDALAHLSRHAPQNVEIATGWDPAWQMAHSGNYVHIVDYPSCHRRLATTADVQNMARLAHTLPEFTRVGKVLTASDVEQRLEPLWSVLQIAKLTNKPIGGSELFFGESVEPLVRMGEILSGKTGDTSLIADWDFWIQPLILDPNQAECFLEKRRVGLPNVPGTMAVAGMSAPITIASTVALSLAELIAGWVLGYVVNPDVPAGGIVATATLDLRTTTACFSSPEALLQNIATANITRRLYGIDVWPIVSYTDCKTPGLQAAFQKMMGLLAAPFALPRGIGTDGLLSAGQDYSPVQHILDCEMNHAVQRFWGHFEVNDDTLAVELLEEAIRTGDANLLESDHTLDHFRTEQWYPRWLDRTSWQGSDQERTAEARMLERINAHCTDAIARYQPPELDAARLRELEQIYAGAERRLAATH